MAAVDLPAPRPAGAGTDPEIAVLDAGQGSQLRVFDAGLACCAVEVAAAVRRWQAQPPASGVTPVHNVFVVAGTVTDKLAPFVLAAYQQTPEPRRVLSFGACANSGGPYWDSYCVTKGVDQFIPVDVYVPGCPPRPEALIAGVQLLLGQEPAR